MNSSFSRSVILLFGVASLAGGVSAHAEIPAPARPLDALVAEMVSHNPEVAFYEAEIEAARRRLVFEWLEIPALLREKGAVLAEMPRDGECFWHAAYVLMTG